MPASHPDGRAARARRYRQAGVVYLVAGVAAVVLTLGAGLVPPLRSARGFLLVPGLLVVVALGLVVVFAPELWRWRWTETATRWLVRALAISSAGRTLLMVLSAAGLSVHVMRGGEPALFVVHGAPQPLFLTCAALTALIVLALGRAGWGGASQNCDSGRGLAARSRVDEGDAPRNES